MSDCQLPLFLDADALAREHGRPGLKIVAVDTPEAFESGHIPGAVRIGYDQISQDRPPVKGLLPDSDALAASLGRIGITPDDHVVAYDRTGGGQAGRLLFSLDVLEHDCFSLLDGGLQAWRDSGRALERGAVATQTTDYPSRLQANRVADKTFILNRLDDAKLKLLDTRSVDEYAGRDRRAARGGHIPGAVHMDWQEFKDEEHRLRPHAQLLSLLAEKGITPADEVVVYCHSHHRSAHTYAALKALGFQHLRGYPGAWSDWGNDPDVPVAG